MKAIDQEDQKLFLELCGIVEEKFNLTLRQITVRRRLGNQLAARCELVYLCRVNTNMTYEQIGSMLGGRSAATIKNSWEQYFRSQIKGRATKCRQ